MFAESDIWLKICFASYFEIECLRNNYYDAIVTETEVNYPMNQYIISTRKFKLVIGKTNIKKPVYYDIPEDGLVWKLLTENFFKLTDKTQKRSGDYWQYHSRRIFAKSGIELNCGFLNYLRICKSKWIESLDIGILEKNKMHRSLQHSYDTTIRWYV